MAKSEFKSPERFRAVCDALWALPNDEFNAAVASLSVVAANLKRDELTAACRAIRDERQVRRKMPRWVREELHDRRDPNDRTAKQRQLIATSIFSLR